MSMNKDKTLHYITVTQYKLDYYDLKVQVVKYCRNSYLH